MATSVAAPSIPPAAAAANEATLNEALRAAKISDDDDDEDEGSSSKEDELEDGEIRDDGDDEEDEEEDDGRVKTVFDDANRFNVKHPLYTQWTLYFDSPQSKLLPKTPSSTPATPQVAQSGWMEDIRKVVSFDSVEEFWGLYNNIIPPSQLPGKANYYLFRENIMPAWEDSANKDGGKWAVQLPREKSKAAIDKMWLYTMLAAIGETFVASGEGEKGATTGSDAQLVTGVIVSARPAFYRISIWTRNAPDVNLPETDPLMAKTLQMGRFFKTSVLGYDDSHKPAPGGLQSDVNFESHRNSEKKGNKEKIVV